MPGDDPAALVDADLRPLGPALDAPEAPDQSPDRKIISQLIGQLADVQHSDVTALLAMRGDHMTIGDAVVEGGQPGHGRTVALRRPPGQSSHEREGWYG